MLPTLMKEASIRSLSKPKVFEAIEREYPILDVKRGIPIVPVLCAAFKQGQPLHYFERFLFEGGFLSRAVYI